MGYDAHMIAAQDANQLLTPEQAATYLQVSRDTVYRYIRDGRLIAARQGRAYRIPRWQLDWLQSSDNRPDITLRDYSAEEVARFLEKDRLTPEAEALMRRMRPLDAHR